MATNCYTGNVSNAVGADDPFSRNAWHLKNTGPSQAVSATSNAGALAGIDANVEPVHRGGAGCTGRSVTIAIVDSGMELAHEDLAPNVLTGKSFNFNTNSADPSPAARQGEVDHGTGVAGIALARGWNGKGARGTAPLARAVAYNAVGSKPVASNGLAVDDNMQYLAFGARAQADANIAATSLFADRADLTDIFNYSAGADYAAPANVSLSPLGASAQHRALAYGTQTLRSGKGAIYFQAAGNEFQSLRAKLKPDDADDTQVACVDFRTAYSAGTFTNPEALTCGSPNHEPENKPYAYNVAAIGNTGKASSYSSSGAAIWVTGFGGEFGTTQPAIITTDNSSCDGGNNNLANKSAFQSVLEFFSRVIADLFGDSTIDPACNYTGQMNGTSAATPSVSGVTALMLEANPALTWQDVGYILAKTSRKVDSSIASADRAVTFKMRGATEGVPLDLPWLTNAAGYNFHNRYGFGLVDATAAVKLASGYTTPAGRRSTNLTVAGPVSNADSAADTANKLKNFRSTVAFTDRTALSGQMQVDIALTNLADLPINPGLLQFEIVNTATGTSSILLPAFTAWYAGGKEAPLARNAEKNFRFHTNAFYGEALAGPFEVRVRSFVAVPEGAAHALSFTPSLTSFSL